MSKVGSGCSCSSTTTFGGESKGGKKMVGDTEKRTRTRIERDRLTY